MKTSRYFLVLAGLFIATAVRSPAVNKESAPLPSVDALLQRVIEKSQNETANDEEFKARYHYTRSKAMEYRNGSGELKKRDTKTRVNRPDPVPTAILVSGPVGGASEAAAPIYNVNTNSTKFDKKELLLNTNILSRFKFTLAGREIIDGRPALIVDFKPLNKELPEPTFKDRFVNKAAGRVWIDEAEAVLVKANLHLVEKVNVFGGIAGAVHKFTCFFGRERTAEGIWYTSLAKWHLEGREVILNRTIDFEEKKTNVKKAW